MPVPSLLALVKGNSSMVMWFCHQLGEWLRGHQSHGSRGLSGPVLEKTLALSSTDNSLPICTERCKR